MKPNYSLIIVLLLTILYSCKKEEPTKTELISRKWHVNKFYWLENGVLREDDRDYDEIIEFKPDNSIIQTIVLHQVEYPENGTWNWIDHEQSISMTNQHGTAIWNIRILTANDLYIHDSLGYYEIELLAK